MCRVASTRWPPDPTAVPEARRFVSDRLFLWSLGPVVSDLGLISSELVTNAYLHGLPPITVTLAADDVRVAVWVADSSDLQPTRRSTRRDLAADLETLNHRSTDPRPVDVDPRHPSLIVGGAGSVEAGRGLQIVETLADEWGVHVTPNGKAVWATLTSPSGWPQNHPCPCPRPLSAPPAPDAFIHVDTP